MLKDIEYSLNERVWSTRANQEGKITSVDKKTLPDGSHYIKGYVVSFSNIRWDYEYHHPNELTKLS